MTVDTVLDQLPPMLTAEEIRAANSRHVDPQTVRTMEFDGREFAAPPGVHLPGKASVSVFERIRDGRIAVAGRTYAAVGCGLGVEAVVAAEAGARTIVVSDVHAPSVEAATALVRTHAGDRLAAGALTLRPIVSDVLADVPDDLDLDVITFNAPTIAVPVSDDPDVVRSVSVGDGIAARFFGELAERRLLAPGGEVYLLASNTSDLAAIVRHGAAAGFHPEIVHVRRRPDIKLEGHLFRFTPADGD